MYRNHGIQDFDIKTFKLLRTCRKTTSILYVDINSLCSPFLCVVWQRV